MSEIIECFAFGSCGVQSAQRFLAREGFVLEVYSRLGFRWRPFVLSSGAALQLYDFCLGERLPPQVVPLAYKEEHQPTAETRTVVEATEIALVELSTPIEPMLGEHVVNINNIRSRICEKFRNTSVDPKLVSGWAAALANGREDLKERAQTLLRHWPSDLEDDGLARFGVENLTVRRLDVDEMVRDLAALRERLGAPMVLQLYQFRYTPDGRAIDWPAGFKAQQMEVARRVGVPTFDMAALVSRLGTKRLITDDLFHWRAETRPLQAEVTYDFLARTLGRPGLHAWPKSAGMRREVRAAFSELDDAPIDLPSEGSVPPPPQQTAVSKRGAARAAARGAPEGEQLVDRLNGELAALHRRRVKELGLEGAGFQGRHGPLLERGTLIRFREEAVLELIDADLPPYDAYGVMRAGIGELALLIAASGRKVIAYEPNRPARAAIEAGAAHLEASGLMAAGALTVLPTLTPGRPLEGRVLGIGLRGGLPIDIDPAPHLARAATFDALLIDPRQFLRRRDDPPDQGGTAKALRALGFDERRDYPADDLAWFRRSGVGTVAGAAAGR